LKHTQKREEQMAFFKKSPEEVAADEQKKQQKFAAAEQQRQQEEENRRLEAELATPSGQAKYAKINGARTFQISLPLSETVGKKGILLGGSAQTTRTEHSTTIDAIEAEGWNLEHANYVYQVTKTVASRSIFSASAQGYDYAYNAEIIGIYIFRIAKMVKGSQIS
jgi:hypothetical protein